MNTGRWFCHWLIVAVWITFTLTTLTACGKTQEDLLKAAFEGDVEAVRECLRARVDVNGRSHNKGVIALMAASVNGQAQVVELLLQRGSDANAHDYRGVTALMAAAQQGHAEVVSLLIENGADPLAQDNDGVPAETYASERGHSDIARALTVQGRAERKRREARPPPLLDDTPPTKTPKEWEPFAKAVLRAGRRHSLTYLVRDISLSNLKVGSWFRERLTTANPNLKYVPPLYTPNRELIEDQYKKHVELFLRSYAHKITVLLHPIQDSLELHPAPLRADGVS